MIPVHGAKLQMTPLRYVRDDMLVSLETPGPEKWTDDADAAMRVANPNDRMGMVGSLDSIAQR